MNIVCKLFGHKPSQDDFWWKNNIDHCDRCNDNRAYGEHFTEKEWYGMLLWWHLTKRWVKDKISHAKFKYKLWKDRKNLDDCPF